jgi:hypothetical protein
MKNKIYTEEQVMNALKLAHSHITSLQNIIDRHLTPIELPSDEEIENGYEPKTMYDLGYLDGAKWMRDKIGGNNEQ